jgi:hypothetical protein
MKRPDDRVVICAGIENIKRTSTNNKLRMWGFLQFWSFIATLGGDRDSDSMSNTLYLQRRVSLRFADCPDQIVLNLSYRNEKSSFRISL